MADLHIGKRVNGYSMIDDQKILLNETLEYLYKEKPQAIILAGDIYDRRNPPIEAVTLFDAFISKVILELKIPVIAIGGNHDGGERLAFASHILANAGFHMAGNFSWPIPSVQLEDEFGIVNFHLMAYADLSIIHTMMPETQGLNYVEAIDWILQHTDLDPSHRHVLIAHGVVVGDEPLEKTDSERELTIGGTEFWQSSALKGFDYVALGHLHRSQRAGADYIRYSGSLMPYSFSEEHHEKVILNVELNEKKQCMIETLVLHPVRPLKTIQGTLKHLLEVPNEIADFQNAYLRVLLEDESSLIEPMQRLKNVFPYIMEMDYIHKNKEYVSAIFSSEESNTAVKAMNSMQLFENFYLWSEGKVPNEAMNRLMEQLFEELGEADK